MRSLLLLLFTSTFAFPQGLVQATYLVRAETATFDPHHGWTHFCVLVYPDGKYRLEREKVDTDNKKSTRCISGNCLIRSSSNYRLQPIVPTSKPLPLPGNTADLFWIRTFSEF